MTTQTGPYPAYNGVSLRTHIGNIPYACRRHLNAVALQLLGGPGNVPRKTMQVLHTASFSFQSDL